MKFSFITLVDVTNTNARFSKTDTRWHQQQNFLTLTQTLSLRVNSYIETVEYSTKDLKNLGFGSMYRGEHTVWSGEFDIEYENGLSIEQLIEDFHLVPVINELDETIKLKDSVFDTKSKQYKNIVFKCVD